MKMTFGGNTSIERLTILALLLLCLWVTVLTVFGTVDALAGFFVVVIATTYVLIAGILQVRISRREPPAND